MNKGKSLSVQIDFLDVTYVKCVIHIYSRNLKFKVCCYLMASPPYEDVIMAEEIVDEIIENEIKAWSQEHSFNSHLVTLKNITKDQDGVRNIQFLLDNSLDFSLRCPANYPDYQDDNFFVEATSSLQLWTNALNEYLLDSSGRDFKYFFRLDLVIHTYSNSN